ncbi:hypothetical protein [Klebsiella pneumoniae]|nr:hypothetical protein [Klebsiella pneumoniae]
MKASPLEPAQSEYYPEDTRQRALKTIGMLRDFGVQHVRTHVDVTDPSGP